MDTEVKILGQSQSTLPSLQENLSPGFAIWLIQAFPSPLPPQHPILGHHMISGPPAKLHLIGILLVGDDDPLLVLS